MAKTSRTSKAAPSAPPPAANPDESLRPALEALAEVDGDFARAYADCGLPPVRGHEPGFSGLLKIIVGQQVSAASARALVRRLEERLPVVTPAAVLALSEAEMKAIGLSRPKMRYARALAEDLEAGRLDLEPLAAMEEEAAIETLMQAKGIGRWTAEIYLLFALKRPDVWPAGDLAVAAAFHRLKGLEERLPEKELRALSEPWRPHRSAAARFLWHYYHHPGVALEGA